MKSILIVSATKGKAEDTHLYKSLHRGVGGTRFGNGETWDLKMYEDNITGLPELYNNHINRKTVKKYDIVLFVHDDVYIDDLDCFAKIRTAISAHQYDIIGLAGGQEVTIKKPALWHLMSKKHFGAVVHPISDQVEDSGCVSVTSFGPTPMRCAVLDGLFLAVNLKPVLDSKWKFNENFKFHHYDISSCLDANKKKLKLGTYPIWVVHSSPGLKDYWNTEYQKSEKKFLELYGPSK
tara:strand:+ start:251 stop:958 length:708 start_codon:yes stop_codon:yes gene_type:complete